MEPTVRPARIDDIDPAYRVFRRSIFAYLHRIGLATAEEAADPPVTSAWKRQAGWVRHLWDTAAENWIATDTTGAVAGWALSVERAGHLELAFFFVDPAADARGLGSRLLDRAFKSRPETARTIMATQDPAAISLYLRCGLSWVATSVDISVRSRSIRPRTDLDLRPMTPDPADLAALVGIERAILGLGRDVDLRFLVSARPGWLAFRGGKPVAYAFGAQPLPAGVTDFPSLAGPVAALDAADLPALIDAIVDAAPADSEVNFCVPLCNDSAVSHLLAMGGKIDPFYLAVLSSGPRMQLDRYIHTSPSFII